MWLKGNPYHWFDQTETLDLEYFSEIINTENIPQCKSQKSIIYNHAGEMTRIRYNITVTRASYCVLM